ncbi:MAG: M48 family metallopeptidase [Proteobacteria bacterium]|nr:M48 family metallopeptidase [Pseudomonadota bacterium]
MGISKIQLGRQLLIKETSETININGDALVYVLRRSKKRTRTLAMKVRKDGRLQLNVPLRSNHKDIEEFIINKYSWIKKQLNKKPQKTTGLMYQDGELHKYQGQDYPLKLIAANFSKVELLNGFIIIYHRASTSTKALLHNWYRIQALACFKQRTKLLANNYNFPKIKAIKVRYMRARWGSCNSRAEITYNVHLIKAPPACIDYVIIHELCHLLHHNHGQGFYQLQAKLNPSWQQQKHELNHFIYN